MCGRVDLSGQFSLRPAKPLSCNQIPASFLHGQISVHDHKVLCPTKLHGQSCQLRMVFIGSIEISHPAKAARGEARSISMCGLQVFRSGNGSPFFGSAADQLSNSAIQLHLGQFCRHHLVQCGVHCTIVNWLSDIHGPLLSGSNLPDTLYQKRKRGVAALSLLIDMIFRIHLLLPAAIRSQYQGYHPVEFLFHLSKS